MGRALGPPDLNGTVSKGKITWQDGSAWSQVLVDSGMWLQWDPHIAAVRELRRMPPPRGLAHLELIEVMFAAFPPPLAQRKLHCSARRARMRARVNFVFFSGEM